MDKVQCHHGVASIRGVSREGHGVTVQEDDCEMSPDNNSCP